MWADIIPDPVAARRKYQRVRQQEYCRRPEVYARKMERQRERRRLEREARDRGEFRNQAHRNVEPPPHVWAERDRAIAAGYSSLVAALAGDPLPGRSAYDRERRA